MNRLRVAWGGGAVTGPGLSTFYSDASLGGLGPSDVVDFFTAIAALFPPEVNWTIPQSGEVINEATGEITGAWDAGTGGGTVAGTGGTSEHAQGVGCRVSWDTAAIRRGRKVRGSTFLVPLRTAVYDFDGSIQATSLATIQAAASALIAAGSASFVVWSRPTTLLSGAMSVVTSARVPDKVSWLRSRRT